MKAAALFLLAFAHPTMADVRLVDFLGGHGCVIGPDSRAAALEAGFSAEQIDALAAAALADASGQKQGDYLVLRPGRCELRLPDGISSPFTVSSPEIVAITSAIDADAGRRGCFLQDPARMFDKLNGGETGAGYRDYFNFIASGIISGDLRFYGTSRLATPPGFQVVTGACADVPDIAAIRQSHVHVRAGFGRYIRLLGEATPCGGRSPPNLEGRLAAYLQGVDPLAAEVGQPPYNAWAWMEYTMIAFAAGWREGMTGTDKGTPRPPLCH